MPPGEDFMIKFKAARPGLHTVVLSPGYYGRCTVLGSNVPFALSTQGSLEVAYPGGKVYFFVPAGLEKFDLSAECKWGSGAAKLTVYRPDGSVALEQETDPYLHRAKLSVPAAGSSGQLWSISVSPLPKKSFNSIFVTGDKRLAPCVTLSPQYIFFSSR
jgi:hypothetical protein